MGNYLAIEASSDACSVALQCGNQVTESFQVKARQHNKILLPAISHLLKSSALEVSDLDGVCFSGGPGSFTGLRMTAATAQGLAFAAKCPSVRVSSLKCLAASLLNRDVIEEGSYIWVLEDARMDEVYSAIYEWKANTLIEILPDCLMDHEHCLKQIESNPEGNYCLLGSGWSALNIQLGDFGDNAKIKQCQGVYPRASLILELSKQSFDAGETLQPSEVLPVYLRETVSWKKWQKKRDKYN